jgi:glutaredoxin
MANCLITLRSGTYSLKAKKLFDEKGLPAQTVKLDGEYAGKGCTHGLRLDCRNVPYAKRLMNEYGIPYSDIKTS